MMVEIAVELQLPGTIITYNITGWCTHINTTKICLIEADSAAMAQDLGEDYLVGVVLASKAVVNYVPVCTNIRFITK
jgi:hypothetical protein